MRKHSADHPSGVTLAAFRGLDDFLSHELGCAVGLVDEPKRGTGMREGETYDTDCLRIATTPMVDHSAPVREAVMVVSPHQGRLLTW
jgi:hypothetical protein